MIDDFIEGLSIINYQVFLFSILLFFIGYTLAPSAYYKKIKWLIVYPFFIINLIDKHFNKDWHPIKIFIVIVLLNSISLFLNLISAYGVILPVIFSIYLGLNLGVVMYHTLEGKHYYLSLLNPVTLIELPAAWLSFAMAIQFSASNYFSISGIDSATFNQYAYYFIITVLPLLIAAGIIETTLIMVAKNFEKNDKNNNESL
jgi:uncharacterized membrane protein SpoIIM required for sporulation